MPNSITTPVLIKCKKQYFQSAHAVSQMVENLFSIFQNNIYIKMFSFQNFEMSTLSRYLTWMYTDTLLLNLLKLCIYAKSCFLAGGKGNSAYLLTINIKTL